LRTWLTEGRLRDYIGQRLPLSPPSEMGRIHAITDRWRKFCWTGLTLILVEANRPGLIPLLGDLLSNAVQTSIQWEMEKKLGEPTTECLTTLIPEGGNKDVSITLWVGSKEGFRLIDKFNLEWAWSASPCHVSPQPHVPAEYDSLSSG
jgi:hypothetical protein